MAIKHGIAVCRLGYDAVTNYNFPTAGHVYVFTGSSLNRKRYDKRKKDEDFKPAAAQIRADNCAAQINGECNTVNLLGYGQDRKQGIKRNRKKKFHSISRNGKKLIRARGAAMFRVGRCKTIVTLSMINKCSDKQAILCLQNFIRSWRKQYGENINYLWVAERQQNGNVHFHILTSHFFNIKKENARWVRVQYNQGITFNLPGGELSRDELEAIIKVGELKDFLNPFDVKKIDTQSGVVAYLTKYITKNIKKKTDAGAAMDEFEFFPWRCSNRVSKIFTGVLAQLETFEIMLSEKNRRRQAKDYFKDGKLKYARGYIHYPIPWFGLWANKIAVYDSRLADGQYEPLDKLNLEILARGMYNGELLKRGGSYQVEQLDAFTYYCLYCREITPEIIELANEPYQNNMVGVTDEFYKDENGRYRCKSFDGALPVPGRYRLKSGSYYDVGRYTKEELIAMQN